jgi:hypothetical protein
VPCVLLTLSSLDKRVLEDAQRVAGCGPGGMLGSGEVYIPEDPKEFAGYVVACDDALPTLIV